MDLVRILVDGLRAAIGIESAAYALAAIGLNMHFGYTGLLNFGHSAFVLLGAYGVAVTVAVLGGSFWLGLGTSVALAIAFALVVGIPTLRLRAGYLAVTTIAAAEILRFVVRSLPAEPLTGGVYGLQQFAGAFLAVNPIPPGRYRLGPLVVSERLLWLQLCAWTLVALATLLVFLLMRSPWGRVIHSIREDEDAARSLGKNVFLYKMQSLCLGGILGAFAGIVLAVSQQAVHPDTYVPLVTFFAYTILILGGRARTFGPVVGAVIFWFLMTSIDTALRQAVRAGLLSAAGFFDPEGVGAVRFALMGLGLVMLMIFRPHGVLGRRHPAAT